MFVEIQVRRDFFLYINNRFNDYYNKLSFYYYIKSILNALDGKYYRLFFKNFSVVYKYNLSFVLEFYFWSVVYISTKKGRLKLKKCHQNLLIK